MINNTPVTSIIGTEVAVLLDTFRRLIRRKANANLRRLIHKTHAADIALLLRYFTNQEKNFIFALIASSIILKPSIAFLLLLANIAAIVLP